MYVCNIILLAHNVHFHTRTLPKYTFNIYEQTWAVRRNFLCVESFLSAQFHRIETGNNLSYLVLSNRNAIEIINSYQRREATIGSERAKHILCCTLFYTQYALTIHTAEYVSLLGETIRTKEK